MQISDDALIHAATVPERVVVTSLADDGGAGTLRAALAMANTHPGEIITFAAGLVGGTIVLSSSLDISASVTIDGLTGTPGAKTGDMTISGDGQVGDFVTTGGTVVLANLNIIDGASVGGTGSAGANENGSGAGIGQAGGAGGQGGDVAGGVLNAGAMLDVVDCRFAGDSAIAGTGGQGGIGGSGFSHNTLQFGAGGGGGGGAGGDAAGAIFTEAGATALQSVRYSNDTATGGYGGTGGAGGTFDGGAGAEGGIGGAYIPGMTTGGIRGFQGSGPGGGGGGGGGAPNQAGGAGDISAADGQSGGGGGGGGGSGTAADNEGGAAAAVIAAAQVGLAVASGAGTISGGGAHFVLALGDVAAGHMTSVVLDVANMSAGLADGLAGTWSVAATAPFQESGFKAVAHLAAGDTSLAGTIVIDPSGKGAIQETLVFKPHDVLGGVSVGSLAPVTLTVMGTSIVAPSLDAGTGFSGVDAGEQLNFADMGFGGDAGLCVGHKVLVPGDDARGIGGRFADMAPAHDFGLLNAAVHGTMAH